MFYSLKITYFNLYYLYFKIFNIQLHTNFYNASVYNFFISMIVCDLKKRIFLGIDL